MIVRLLAAGTRMPDWVTSGVDEYVRRFGGQLKFELKEISLSSCDKRCQRWSTSIPVNAGYLEPTEHTIN